MVNMQGYDPRGSTKARYRAIRQHDQLHGTNWTIEAMRSAVSSEPCRSFADVDRQFEPDNAEAAEVRQAAQASEAYANCTNPSQRYKTLLELKESLGKNWSRLSMCKVADVGQANCLKIENANLAPKGLAKLIRDEVFGTRKAATKADAYRAILDYRDTHAKAWNVSDMRSAAQIDPDQASDVEFHRAPDWAEVDTLRTAVQNEAAFTAASSAKTRYEALLAIKTRTGADWAERDMIKLSGIVLSNAARVHRALQLPPPSRPTVPGAAAPGRT